MSSGDGQLVATEADLADDILDAALDEFEDDIDDGLGDDVGATASEAAAASHHAPLSKMQSIGSRRIWSIHHLW